MSKLGQARTHERRDDYVSLEEPIRRKGEGQTDWERLRREQESGLEPEVDPDEGGFDWSQVKVVMPPSK